MLGWKLRGLSVSPESVALKDVLCNQLKIGSQR